VEGSHPNFILSPLRAGVLLLLAWPLLAMLLCDTLGVIFKAEAWPLKLGLLLQDWGGAHEKHCWLQINIGLIEGASGRVQNLVI